jgi:hypothetical protein
VETRTLMTTKQPEFVKLDLVRAYGLIRHIRFADGAEAVGFRRTVLGLLCKMFSAPRRISVDGCVSKEMRVLVNTILAGSVFRPLLLRFALHAPLGWWSRRWPNVALSQHCRTL